MIGLVMGMGFTALLLVNQDDPVDRGTKILGALALGAITSLPGILAMLARRRPVLYLCAGIVGLPLAFISFGGVTLPLLLPAGMALVGYGRRAADSVPRLSAPVTAMMALVLGIGAFVVLIGHDDPRCSATTNGTTCTSDVVTSLESGASLAITSIAIAVTWTLARPQAPEPSLPVEASGPAGF